MEGGQAEMLGLGLMALWHPIWYERREPAPVLVR